jgi:hypothetical protein
LEDKCCSVLETTTKYFSGRAKLLTRCLKYPDVLDYRRSIEEVDHSASLLSYYCRRRRRRHYHLKMHKSVHALVVVGRTMWLFELSLTGFTGA